MDVVAKVVPEEHKNAIPEVQMPQDHNNIAGKGALARIVSTVRESSNAIWTNPRGAIQDGKNYLSSVLTYYIPILSDKNKT